MNEVCGVPGDVDLTIEDVLVSVFGERGLVALKQMPPSFYWQVVMSQMYERLCVILGRENAKEAFVCWRRMINKPEHEPAPDFWPWDEDHEFNENLVKYATIVTECVSPKLSLVSKENAPVLAALIATIPIAGSIGFAGRSNEVPRLAIHFKTMLDVVVSMWQKHGET